MNLKPEQKAKITTLKVTSTVSNLAEDLKNFTTLESLDLSETVLTEENIDFNTLPKTITTVKISNNETVKNISLKNSNVKDFDAKGCENLESLDVEGNTQILSLDVSNSQNLKSMNVKNCANLQNLIFDNCSFDEKMLNVEGCTNLKKLSFKRNRFLRFDWTNTLLPNLSILECEGQRERISTIPAMFNISIFFTLNRISASAEDETSSFANLTDIKAKDANGNEILPESYDKETGEIKFSSPVSEVTYNYITGFNDVKMDVTISAGSVTPIIGSSGGGCNLGFGAMILFAAGLLMLKSKN